MILETTEEVQDRLSKRVSFGEAYTPGTMAGVLSAPFEGVAHGIGTLSALGYGALAKATDSEYMKDSYQSAVEFVNRTRVNPNEVGAAGQLLHQLGSIFAVGATVGPLTGPAAVPASAAAIGATSGLDKYHEIYEQTRDEETATKLGITTGLTMGAGALLPPFIGKAITTQIASGVGINVALGAAERGVSGKVLADNGLNEMASHYNAMDMKQAAFDAVLGALFPMGARILNGTKADVAVDAAILHHLHQAEQERGITLPSDFKTLDEAKAAMLEGDRQLFVEGKNPMEITPPPIDENALANPLFGRDIIAGHEADVALNKQMGESRAEVENIANAIAEAEKTTPANKDVEAKSPAEVKPPAESITPESFLRQDAKRIVDLDPERMVQTLDGKEVSAAKAMELAKSYAKNVESEKQLYDAALACYLSEGN